MRIGSVVKLKIDIMDCKEGDIGVCYEEYSIGLSKGYSIIFHNGDYCGFNIREVDFFFNIVGQEELTYYFKGVMTLAEDFNNGYFKNIFNRY